MARKYLCKYLNILAVIVTCLEARSDFSQIGCACLGHPLTFQCSTIGGGTTVWQGSAFNCPLSSDEIHLLHSQFQTRNAIGNCNNGAIIGQGLRIEEPDCFVSQLTIVNITSTFNGKRVECLHDNGRVVSIINMTEISIIYDPPPHPMDIYLMDINKHQMTFSWNPVRLSACRAVQYYILNATNCGVCPSITNITTATCSNYNINYERPMSNVTTVALKVPRVSLQSADVIATYSSDNNTLIKLDTTFIRSIGFAITEGVDGSATSYTITYSESSSEIICDWAIISPDVCPSNICHHSFQVSSSPCSTSNDINVTLFATNVLGNGTSVSLTKGGVNNFVNVTHDFMEGTVTCQFPFLLKSNKICNITYFRDGCQQSLFTVSGETDSNSITLQLNHDQQLIVGLDYCFAAKASNISTSVTIKGSFTYQDYASVENNAMVVALTTSTIFVSAIIITLAVVFFLVLSKKVDRSQYSMVSYKKNTDKEVCDVYSPTYIEIQEMNTVDATDNDYHWCENNSYDEGCSEMVSYRLLNLWNTCSD